MNYGKVLKIVDKNHKDGLKSGMRIITMKKCEIEMKPIPSYVKIEGCELYVTYSGQQITCKYCGNKGHVQSNCQKRLQDFPNLTSDQSNGNIFKSASIENFEISADNIKLPKKRKLASDLNDSHSNFQIAKLCAEERSDDQTLNKPKMHHNTEPQATVEVLSSLSDGENISTNEIDSNVQQKEWWQETSEPFQILSTDNNKHSMNWWEMSNQISCISCKTVNNVNENNSSFSCVECGEEQIVADTCCDEPSSNKRFAVRVNELETECPTCKSEMIKLPCCDQFRQKSIIDDNIYNCKVCEKYSIGCVCEVINKLPPKAMSWKCSRLKCHHFTIHCECGRITYQELKSSEPYKCPCGYEYEQDIEIGVCKI